MLPPRISSSNQNIVPRLLAGRNPGTTYTFAPSATEHQPRCPPTVTSVFNAALHTGGNAHTYLGYVVPAVVYDVVPNRRRLSGGPFERVPHHDRRPPQNTLTVFGQGTDFNMIGQVSPAGAEPEAATGNGHRT